MVYLEQLTSTTFLDHPTTVASYERILAEIDSNALDPALSRTKLATITTVPSKPPDYHDTPEALCNGGPGRLLTTAARPDTDGQARMDVQQ